MAAGGHLEFWWLDWSKCKNDARNGFSMPKLVGKVVLHSFRYQFVFKLHFQYGQRRPFWIWLLTNSAAIFARVMGANFFLNTSKSSNQVSNLSMLSVVTGPPDCTQLCVLRGEFVLYCSQARMTLRSPFRNYSVEAFYNDVPECVGMKNVKYTISPWLFRQMLPFVW